MQTTSRRLAILCAITLILSFGLSVWSVVMFRQLGDLIYAAEDVVSLELAERDSLLGLVNEETGVRAYVATSEGAFLDTFREGRRQFADNARIVATQARRAGLTADVVPLRAAGDDLQRYFTSEVGLVSAGHRAEATRGMSFGKMMLDRYRRLDDGLQRAVVNLSVDRTTATRRTVNRALIVRIVAVTVFALLGLAFVPVVRSGARFERDAMSDAVTQLANRRAFLTRLAERCAEPKPFATVLIDLDGFKRVNDTLGHATGDRVLRLTGERLRAELRTGDCAARLGGDEFAVLLDGITTHQAADRVVARLCAAIERPSSGEDGTIARVGASAGVVLYPADARDGATLLAGADRAMYAHKRARRSASEQDPQRHHANA